MRMWCECGYLMSDILVPNHTNLHIYTTKALEYEPSKHILVFHCECCHRLHMFASKYTEQKFFVFGLLENGSHEQCEHFSELNIFYIRNDYNQIFEGRYCEKCKRLYIHYRDNWIMYIVERINEVNGSKSSEIYHTDKKIINRYLSSEMDMSVAMRKTRCPCGWLINKDYIDGLINIYNNVNWKQRILFEFGEIDKFPAVSGLCCEKCKRLFIPNKNNKYNVYCKSNTSQKISNSNCLKLYFINNLDDGMINFENKPNPEDVLNTIYISSDQKHLEVHENDDVSNYFLSSVNFHEQQQELSVISG